MEGRRVNLEAGAWSLETVHAQAIVMYLVGLLVSWLVGCA